MTLEERIEKIKDLRPIDDVFFEVLAQDKEVCEEMLRTIMEDDLLTVSDVTVQSSERNLYGRSVRLDALCTLGNGTLCNIEVQRSNNDDHLCRARYNASMITAKETDIGTHFGNIPEVYVIYISEFDFLKGGRTIYHIEKVIKETVTFVDDGFHEIFVNTSVNDGTNISALMRCMMQKEVNDSHFPKLVNRVKFLKTSEGGKRVVCEIMENMIAEAVNEAVSEVANEANTKAVINMLRFKVDEDEVRKLYPAEFEEGKRRFLEESN